MRTHPTPEGYPPAQIVTKKELARELRLCERTIDNLVTRKLIEKIKIGASARFDLHEVIARLKNQSF